MPLISLRQAAKILGISQRTALRLVTYGELKGQSFGDNRAIFVEEDDVKKIIPRKVGHPKKDKQKAPPL